MRRPPFAARLLLASGLLLPASATRAQDCLDCHGQPGLTVTFRDGSTMDATIDPKAWAASVHGSIGLPCADCHPGHEEYPHPEVTAASARDYTLFHYTTCQQCHEEQFKQQLDSVHIKAIAAGNKSAAVCSDCHNPHTQKRITGENGRLLPEARIAIPRTCARCHGAIYAKYRQSVHGAALVTGNPDVPTCIDCHGVHNIANPLTPEFRLASPHLCAHCHTDRKRMAKYHLSTQVLRTYVADFHGSTVTLFERRQPGQVTNVPVCTDCHGVHDIVRVDDPKYGLEIKANLLRTCRKCHPNATTNFPSAWLSHYIPSPQHNALVYWAQVFYNILIPTVVGGMALFVAADFVRRRIDRRRHLERRRRGEPS
jgi:hypothetical protein